VTLIPLEQAQPESGRSPGSTDKVVGRYGSEVQERCRCSTRSALSITVLSRARSISQANVLPLCKQGARARSRGRAVPEVEENFGSGLRRSEANAVVRAAEEPYLSYARRFWYGLPDFLPNMGTPPLFSRHFRRLV
jgi:hypothetical protein